jgi:hypothetical protein
MPGSLRPDWQYGSARVAANGSSLYIAGAVRSVVRTGVGEYSVLTEGANESEHVPFLETEEIADTAISRTVGFQGSTLIVKMLGVTTVVLPVDVGFWIEINRVR